MLATDRSDQRDTAPQSVGRRGAGARAVLTRAREQDHGGQFPQSVRRVTTCP